MTGTASVAIAGPGAGDVSAPQLPGVDPAAVVVDRAESGPVDARGARALAMRALRRALASARSEGKAFGLAVGLGERSIHVAKQATGSTVAVAAEGPEGVSARERADAAGVLARALASGDPIDIPGWEVRVDRADAEGCGHPGLADLLAGRRARVAFALAGPDGREPDHEDEPTPLILPGSFRPFHEGHGRMAEFAARLAGGACGYDLSLFHPEKPPLDYLAIRSRLRGFDGARGRLTLTNAPTYVEKARVFPGATFVVGHDAAERIIDPRYYGGPEARDAMLGELEALGTRLLVFGRVDDAGRFRAALDDPAVANFVARHATFIPESAFRVDLSSTLVRARHGIDPD